MLKASFQLWLGEQTDVIRKQGVTSVLHQIPRSRGMLNIEGFSLLYGLLCPSSSFPSPLLLPSWTRVKHPAKPWIWRRIHPQGLGVQAALGGYAMAYCQGCFLSLWQLQGRNLMVRSGKKTGGSWGESWKEPGGSKRREKGFLGIGNRRSCPDRESLGPQCTWEDRGKGSHQLGQEKQAAAETAGGFLIHSKEFELHPVASEQG